MLEPQSFVGRTSVSVAICTHNGEQFIEEQLRSVLAQTRVPTQIVVSDDASTDRTVEVVRTVIAANEQINPDSSTSFSLIINAVPLGVAANFEQAINACTGKFVALCDQDDVWLPRRVEAALDAFDRHPSLLLVHSDARLIDEGGAELAPSLFRVLGRHVSRKSQRPWMLPGLHRRPDHHSTPSTPSECFSKRRTLRPKRDAHLLRSNSVVTYATETLPASGS